jgi:hypothetical protein
MPKENGGGVQIPADLSTLTDEELETLENSAMAEFDTLDDDENTDAEGLSRMTALADGVDNIRTARTDRAARAAESLAQREAVRGRIHAETGTNNAHSDETAQAAVPAVVAAGTTDVRDVLKNSNANLNARLSDAAAQVPAGNAPKLRDEFAASVLVASADIAGFTTGGRLNDMAALVRAFQSRARSLPVSKTFSANEDWRYAPRYPVASLQRKFQYTLDDTSSPDDTWAVMQAAANPQALVAAGGWCSPSEIRYDFYNIADTDGLLDLPTTGIRRGGLRWPTSPSFGDLSGSAGLWHWNETQDVAAATGTSQSGSKTCARVPCADFSEERLEGEGICITAGNLATDAWPEALADFLRLVNVYHAHRVNAWMINALVQRSISVSVCVTGMGVAIPVLDAIEMQVTDYRTRFAMADSAVLECVLPSWILAEIRADLAKRMFASPDYAFAVTNAMIGSWFTLRNVRVQFVQDWQVRTAGFPGRVGTYMTTWPTTVKFLLYAAGTFLRGNGLTLDLGVVRDSTLNATNDHTAAWSEEFFLVAEIGHQSLVVTVPICPNGVTGAPVDFTCPSC